MAGVPPYPAVSPRASTTTSPARVGVAAGPGVTVVDTVYEAGTSASRMSVYSDPFCCSLPSLISKVSSE